MHMTHEVLTLHWPGPTEKWQSRDRDVLDAQMQCSLGNADISVTVAHLSQLVDQCQCLLIFQTAPFIPILLASPNVLFLSQVPILRHLRAVTISQAFLVFGDLDSSEKYWSGILQAVLQRGSV